MSPKIKICKETDCVSEQSIQGYCRLHYLKNWKILKKEKQKKSLQSLNRYIDNIVKTVPDRFVETLKGNIREPLDFAGSASSFSKDEFDTVLGSLGYSEELDEVLNHIKVDKDF